MAERCELQPDGTWVNGVGTILPHEFFPEPDEGQDAWVINAAVSAYPEHIDAVPEAEETYRYWIT